MIVLAILQNQWFRDPERVRAFIERRPELRRNFIRRALFVGCRTGRVLKAGLGEEWCRKIVWEEASPQIGGEASARFPADLDHLCALLAEVKPDIAIALGKVASDAITTLVPTTKRIIGPHPTARGVDTIAVLRDIRVRLENISGERLVRTALNPRAAWPFPEDRKS